VELINQEMVINMTKYENGIHVCETAAKGVGRKRLGDLGWLLELFASFGLAGRPGNHLSP
jgi:hypothetical protein